MKDPLFNITYGLYVITANVNGRDNGCISDTLCQVTMTPQQVSVCLNKSSLTCEMVAKSGAFTASIISMDAKLALFKHFGFQSGRDVNKFADFTDTRRVANGSLAITEGTNSYISAKVTGSVDLGTYILFIGEVTEKEILSDSPSMTYAYYQSNVKPQPAHEHTTEPDSQGRVVWRCKVCGYEYVGEELPADFVCPLCKRPASDFERVVEQVPAE